MRNGLQRIERFVHAFHPAFLRRFLGVGNGRVDLAGDGADFFAVLVERLFHLIDEPVEFVARFDLFAFGRVFSRVRVSIFHHAIDFVFAQTGR